MTLFIVGIVVCFAVFYLSMYFTTQFHKTKYYRALDTEGTLVRLRKTIVLSEKYDPPKTLAKAAVPLEGAEGIANAFIGAWNGKVERVIEAGAIGTVGNNGYYFDGVYVYRRDAVVNVISVPKSKKKKRSENESDGGE